MRRRMVGGGLLCCKTLSHVIPPYTHSYSPADVFGGRDDTS